MSARTLMLGAAAALLAAGVAAGAAAQPPVARPVDPPGTTRPGTTTAKPAPPGTAAPKPATPVQPPGTKPSPVGPPAASPAPAQQAPSEALLGVPIFPSAQFITSYDAGQGQRFYLYGTTASFAEMVAYYRTVLKQKGELVFDQPATHMFEVGKYKETDVAFPPGVTIKDYAGPGLKGFTNPVPGATPAQFKTIIQIVPGPPGSGGRPR
jgi:hypothetical protein